jgi:hypothetical protein
MNTTPTRSLRRLPVKKGGKVTARYAVIVDDEQIGEIFQVRGYGLWYAKTPSSPHPFACDYPSRLHAAIACCKIENKGV